MVPNRLKAWRNGEKPVNYGPVKAVWGAKGRFSARSNPGIGPESLGLGGRLAAATALAAAIFLQPGRPQASKAVPIDQALPGEEFFAGERVAGTGFLERQ